MILTPRATPGKEPAVKEPEVKEPEVKEEDYRFEIKAPLTKYLLGIPVEQLEQMVSDTHEISPEPEPERPGLPPTAQRNSCRAQALAPNVNPAQYLPARRTSTTGPIQVPVVR